MRINLDTYIIEKLHLNKDIKNPNKEISCLTDLYEVGDKCLIIKLTGIGINPKIHIDAVEITNKSKTILYFKCLTNTGWSCDKSRLIVNRNDNIKIKTFKTAWHDGSSSIYIMIPTSEVNEVLEQIEDNNLKVKNFSNLYIKNQSLYINDYKLVEMKNKKEGEWHASNLTLMSQSSFDEIKRVFNI